MKTPRSTPAGPIALLALTSLITVVLAAAPSCSDNNVVPPGTTAVGTGASTTTTTTTTAGTGASSTTTTGTGASTTTTTTTTGTGGSDAGPPCVPDGGDAGCYSCPPLTNAQFLNACASNDQCAHFDNAARLPAWDGGALPPVP